MIGFKSTVLGMLAVAGFLAAATEAQACGKKKRRGGNDCGYAAPCDPCATGGPMYRADAYPGGAPLAMPTRGASVIPADGSRIPATSGVVPASGTIPASDSYWYDPRTGSYYQSPNNQGFVPGVIQGSTGSYYYPSKSPASYAGRRMGGLFRR